MGNGNYYSKVDENSKYYNSSYEEDFCNKHNECNDKHNECNDKHDECNDKHHKNRENCCGKRFNNRKNDEKVQRALKAFERQLNNTEEAIDCLNKLFNNVEDALFEDRCCLSNRIKNILRSIQTEICDLEDDVRNIEDDVECLEQAL